MKTLLCLLSFMWFVFILNLIIPYNLNTLGIEPRTLSGLVGVVCSPFLHIGFSHIFSNTIFFLIVSPIVLAYNDNSFKLLCCLIVASGIITWMIGTTSIHIGASGLIYAIFTYGFVNSYCEKKYFVLILVGFLLFYFGGGLAFGLLPKEGISWTGHLSGCIAGFIIGINSEKFVKTQEKL